MSFMLEEIRQQPEVITKLVDAERAAAQKLAEEIKRRGIEFVVMAARGTSDHAAIYGKYLLEINNAMPVALADPSVFTLYNANLNLGKSLVIGISQSGEAPDVAEYLQRAKDCGALTLAITNEPGSKITTIAEVTILCHAGKEKSVAATKTYTSTLAALYMLSASLMEDRKVDDLLACADGMAKVLTMDSFIAEKAERYRYMDSGVVLGRGLNYCTALETALKLKETNYIGLQSYSAADFLHGPIATVSDGYPCFIIAPPGKAYSMMFDVTKRLKDTEAETIIFSSEDDILALASNPFKIDVKIDEELSPLVYIIPGQLFAYHLAISRGNDPDRPRGLSKVTRTR